MANAFLVLGFRDDTASNEDIKAAYKRMMRDILSGKSRMTTSELNSAYNEIKTPDRMRAYKARFPLEAPRRESSSESVYRPDTPRRRRKLYPDPEDVEPEKPAPRPKKQPEPAPMFDPYMYDWGPPEHGGPKKKRQSDWDEWGRWRKGVFRY